MRILVTGGAGFIGSNFVRCAVKKGWEVIVYDKLTYAGRLENLNEVLSYIKFIHGDILDEGQLAKIIIDYNPNVIVNFAAETHVDRSINEPASFIKTNILGLFSLLENVRKYDIELFLHVSTDEVYGDLWNDKEADEVYPLNPSSPYAASKAAGDLLILAYGRTYGLRYRIVRPCNNYGPYQHPEKLIPRTIIRLLHGKPAVIYGSGMQIRDWIYVEDCVEAITFVLEKGSDREIYNICANMHACVKDIIEEIIKIMGYDPAKFIIYSKNRPGEDMKYAMKCDKIQKIGWKPKVTLYEGLRRTVKWYLENKWWWMSVIDEKYVLSDAPW